MKTVNETSTATAQRRPWNKGKLIGPKPPLQPKHVWAIRTRLQLAGRTRDLALFNLAIDSKLRGCDVVSLRSRTSRHMAIQWTARPFGRAKLVVRSGSRSPSRPARRSTSTLRQAGSVPAISCSVAKTAASRPANMPACYRSGSPASASTRRCSAPPRCGEPRRP